MTDETTDCDPLMDLLGRRFAALEGRPDGDVPTHIGEYEVVRKIGEGGQAVVYEGRQPSVGRRRVAIKLMKSGFLQRQELQRIKREVLLHGQLDHPNIVPIHDAKFTSGTDRHQPYFVMEYVDGGTLLEYVRSAKKERGFSIREKIELFLPVCHAIQHAHEKGAIHRDIKPSNILVKRGSKPNPPMAMVADFGIAIPVDLATTRLTQEGELAGTLAYMCPERVNAEGGVPTPSVRWDVYSLGAVLYELLAEKPAFDFRNATYTAAVKRICEQDPQPLSDLIRGLDADIETIVSTAMHKLPKPRYETAGAMARDLQRYLDGEPIEARRESTFRLLRRRVKRYRYGLTVAVTVACIVTAISLYANSQRRLADQRRQEGDAMYQVLLSLRPSNPDDPARPAADPRTAVERAKQLLAKTTDKHRMAEFLHDVGHILDVRGESKAARTVLELAVDLREQLAREGGLSPGESRARQLALADAVNRLAWCKVHLGDPRGAVEDARRVVDLRSRVKGAPAPEDDVIAGRSDLARIKMLAGDKDGGVKEFVGVLASVCGERPDAFNSRLHDAVKSVGLAALTPSGRPKAEEKLATFVKPFLAPGHPRLRERTPWTLAQFAEYLHSDEAPKAAFWERPVIESAARFIASYAYRLARNPDILPAGHSDIRKVEEVAHRLKADESVPGGQ